MSHSTRLWILIALVSLGNADAQQLGTAKIPAVASEHATDRGLLLGIYLPNEASWDDLRNEVQDQKWVPDISMDPQGKYLTFWISRSGGGSVKIQAIEGLLVPRATGFWHIGTQMATAEEHPESDFDEEIWAVPVGEKPAPPKSDSGIDGRSVRLITMPGRHTSPIFSTGRAASARGSTSTLT